MTEEKTKPTRATIRAPTLSDSVPATPPKREGIVIAMKMAPLAEDFQLKVLWTSNGRIPSKEVSSGSCISVPYRAANTLGELSSS